MTDGRLDMLQCMVVGRMRLCFGSFVRRKEAKIQTLKGGFTGFFLIFQDGGNYERAVSGVATGKHGLSGEYITPLCEEELRHFVRPFLHYWRLFCDVFFH